MSVPSRIRRRRRQLGRRINGERITDNRSRDAIVPHSDARSFAPRRSLLPSSRPAPMRKLHKSARERRNRRLSRPIPTCQRPPPISRVGRRRHHRPTQSADRRRHGDGWQTGLEHAREWHRRLERFRQALSGARSGCRDLEHDRGGARRAVGRGAALHPVGPPQNRRRARYVVKATFSTQRRDGRLAPAWGRYAGNVFNNLIENAWLPPSVTTPGQTVTRSLLGMASRLGGNAWDEFWPDAWRLFRKQINK